MCKILGSWDGIFNRLQGDESFRSLMDAWRAQERPDQWHSCLTSDSKLDMYRDIAVSSEELRQLGVEVSDNGRYFSGDLFAVYELKRRLTNYWGEE